METTYQKLIIESFGKPDFSSPQGEFSTEFFNPDAYEENCMIEYQNEQGIGTNGLAQRYKKSNPEEFSLGDIIIDGTHTQEPHELEPSCDVLDVQAEVDKFKEVTSKYIGEEHRTPFLKISWGKLIFKCVLKSCNVKYSYFGPDGSPLRATIKATFCHHVEDEARVNDNKTSSPDLTHIRIVKAGDTLPNMAYRIYGDASYYLEVARANSLRNFRQLEPGQELIFPPIDKT